MQWSQLKQRIEALFADTVKGRVELHVTRYHKAPDQMGRGWITFDKLQIISMSDLDYEYQYWQEASRLQKVSECLDYRNPDQREGYYQAYDQAENTLHNGSVFSRGDFTRSLRLYLNTSVEDILKSRYPLIRALGMLDHRVGKRRLASLDVTTEHPLVQKLYALRCAVEGLSTTQ